MEISENTIREIEKQAHTIFSVFAAKKSVHDKTVAYVCNLHPDKHASLMVSKDGDDSGKHFWKCAACGKRGRDVLSFVAVSTGMNLKSQFRYVVAEAAKIAGIEVKEVSEEEKKSASTNTSAQRSDKKINAVKVGTPQYLQHHNHRPYIESNLYKYLTTLWSETDVQIVMNLYQIGTSNGLRLQDCTECTTFPTYDEQDRLCSVKTIPYPTHKHQRIKGKKGAEVIWQKGKNLPTCFFGANLIKQCSSHLSVSIVESEKSAVIGTLYDTSTLWLATQSKGNFSTSESCMAFMGSIKGRVIHVWPDADALEEWREVCDHYKAQGYDIRFRDELISEFPKDSKIDIADLVVWQREEELKQQITKS